IKFQTIESFKFKLVSTFMQQKQYLNTLYDDLDKYINNMNTSKNKSLGSTNQTNTSQSVDQNRQAFADTPQDEVNLNLDNDRMTYATDNTISKNKNNSNSKNDTIVKSDNEQTNYNYQLDTFIKSSLVYNNVMKTFDKECFLQIW
ncbi:hypothetical protein V6O07_19715, partial [Arthrospira platensis SPKY2]